MGFARDGTVIRDGDPLRVQGMAPSGIAAGGTVIYRGVVEPPPPAGGLSIVTSVVFGTTRNNHNGYVGMAITTHQPLVISALGKWVLPENIQPVNMLLTDQYGNAYRSAVLDVSSSPPNQFAYVSLDQPFTTARDEIYCVFIETTVGGDDWGAGDAILTFGPDADALAAYGIPGFLGQRPTIQWGDPPNSYGPVDCLYEIGAT